MNFPKSFSFKFLSVNFVTCISNELWYIYDKHGMKHTNYFSIGKVNNFEKYPDVKAFQITLLTLSLKVLW